MDGVPRVPEQQRPGSDGARGVALQRARPGARLARTRSSCQRAPRSNAPCWRSLLLREGRTATAAELIDALWGDEPPSQALAAVRTYASRLQEDAGPRDPGQRVGRLRDPAVRQRRHAGPRAGPGTRGRRREGPRRRRSLPRPRPAEAGAEPVGRGAAGEHAGPVRGDAAGAPGGVASPTPRIPPGHGPGAGLPRGGRVGADRAHGGASAPGAPARAADARAVPLAAARPRPSPCTRTPGACSPTNWAWTRERA